MAADQKVQSVPVNAASAASPIQYAPTDFRGSPITVGAYVYLAAEAEVENPVIYIITSTSHTFSKHGYVAMQKVNKPGSIRGCAGSEVCVTNKWPVLSQYDVPAVLVDVHRLLIMIQHKLNNPKNV